MLYEKVYSSYFIYNFRYIAHGGSKIICWLTVSRRRNIIMIDRHSSPHQTYYISCLIISQSIILNSTKSNIAVYYMLHIIHVTVTLLQQFYRSVQLCNGNKILLYQDKTPVRHARRYFKLKKHLNSIPFKVYCV